MKTNKGEEHMSYKKGFTLIELLIVVAIIAILAMIAVPNFLEAQTRAKVVRVKADFRNLLVAMNAYHVDYNSYPPDWRPGGAGSGGWWLDFIPLTALTTPVAYIASVPTNPFFDVRASQAAQPVPGETGRGNYGYWGWNLHPAILPIWWHVASCGPDLVASGAGGKAGYDIIGRTATHINTLYDPTNGTVSSGDLLLTDRGMAY